MKLKQSSLFSNEDAAGEETLKVRPPDPYWFARTLSGMLFGDRPAIQGGPYPRADIEEQLRRTLMFWCRFANVVAPDEPSAELLAEFEALFVKHWHLEGRRTTDAYESARHASDRAAHAAAKELAGKPVPK